MSDAESSFAHWVFWCYGGLVASAVVVAIWTAMWVRPLLMLSVLLVVIGVQMVAMGFPAELMMRTCHESQGKPIYVVREVLNGSTDDLASGRKL